MPNAIPGSSADDNLVVGRRVLAPRRPDDEAAADAQHGKVLLPRLGPVLLVDDARLELADVAQLEGLQVAQVAPRRRRRRRARRAGRSPHVTAHDGRPRDVSSRVESPSSMSSKGASTDDAARADPRQDLADLLDGLLVGADRQLEPRPGRGQPLVRVGQVSTAQLIASRSRSDKPRLRRRRPLRVLRLTPSAALAPSAWPASPSGSTSPELHGQLLEQLALARR